MIYLIVIIIILIVLVLISYFKIDITKYNIINNKIDKNIKILFLSDLHNRNIINKVNTIVKEEKPDIIIFGGDMIQDSIRESKNFFKLIHSLKNESLYYTFGNHEERMSELKEYTDLVNKENLILLNNKNIKLSNNIMLYGLNSEIERYANFKKVSLNKEYIESKLGKINKKKFNILLGHNPLEFEGYVESEYDLVLSGHVHGGIIILPIFGPLLSPDFTFFPKYSRGSYIKNNTQMIVSRGLGFSKAVPFRFLNPGEVIIVNLMKK